MVSGISHLFIIRSNYHCTDTFIIHVSYLQLQKTTHNHFQKNEKETDYQMWCNELACLAVYGKVAGSSPCVTTNREERQK